MRFISKFNPSRNSIDFIRVVDYLRASSSDVNCHPNRLLRILHTNHPAQTHSNTLNDAPMKRRPLFSTAVLVLLFAQNSVGQHLPTGTYHPNHERTYDIVHYRSDLKLDWIAKKVFGESTIRLRPLTRTSKVSLGAFWLSVRSVRSLPEGKELAFASTDSTLVIDFGRVVEPSDTMTLAVSHSSIPTAGVYFVDAPAGSGGLQTL